MLDSTQLRVVIKPLDRVLVSLRFGLIPLVAICLSLPIITSSLQGSGERLTGLVGPLIAICYLMLLQLQSVGDRVDWLLASVRRRIAMACDHDYGSTHEERGLACYLTPDVFQAPLFRYEGQTELVLDLAHACVEEDPCRFWFVEGRSGTGKTRTALRLVQALIRDNRLFTYACRCHLYDFSRSPSVQTDLVRKLRRGRLARGVVLVDNFHLVTPVALQQLTDLIIDRRESRPAHLLVFFTRPGDAWTMGPGSDVRLLSEAKTAGCYVELSGPPANVVEDGVAEIDEMAADLVAGLRRDGIASAAQLHLAQVIARNGSAPEDVLITLHLLLGRAEGPEPPPDLIGLLGILAGLSVHRGSFSRRELRGGIMSLAREKDGPGLLNAAGLLRSFRRLRKLGLVTRLDSDGALYLFHEELAELCVDRLAHLPIFESSLRAIGKLRLSWLTETGEALETWLVATEIGDRRGIVECFEAALAAGAMKRMLPCLRRAQARGTLSPTQRLELAILLDRTGEFAESRELFTDERLREAAVDNNLALLLAASRVEVNHPSLHELDLQILLDDRDPLVNLIGSYWELHVDTHFGRFAPDPMLAVAEDALPMVEARGRFWQVHSLGRMHFDSLRAFYLSGSSAYRELESKPRRRLDAYLKSRLPNYAGMHLLYRNAHLLGHILLPRLALLGRPVDADAAAFAGVELQRSASVQDLAKGALQYYLRARDEFWQVGDREAAYLKADVLNARMIQGDADLPQLRVALDDYRDFIATGGFTMLNGYPHFYYFRWHLLMHFRDLGEGMTAAPAEDHLAQAREALDEMIEIDSLTANEYALQRGRLLTILMGGFDGPLDVVELTEASAKMEELGYGFERDLLDRLIVQSGRLTPVELWDIFRYLPFVHQ
ncbi:MAG: hypothetical protein JST59_09670 [Actinobacteria bacterium]|nr:hypothetical protein [Actinomycetota bacterium]